MNYSLPKNWQATTIGKVATVSSGSTPLRARHNDFFQDGTIPWVKTMDLTNGEIIITDEKITELAAKKCKPHKPRTVLVAMYGGFNQIGRTGLLKINAAINQAISAISLDESIVIPEYLLRYLNAKIAVWKNFAASSRKDPNITRKDVCNFPLILPPIEEQKRIVAILEIWDKAIAKLKKKIDLKKRTKRGLERGLLTGKTRLPGFKEKWETVKLSSLFERVSRTATSKEPLQSYSISSKIGFETQEEKYSRVMSGKSLDKYILLKNGEFAYNKGNSITYPHGCIYEFEENEGLVPFVYICFKNKGKVSSSFYKHYFLQRMLDKELKAHITTSVRGNGLLNISPEDFFSCKVLSPSLDEQNAIASVLDTMDSELNALSKKLERLKQQKTFLLNNLITGRIRTPENMSLPKP